MIDVVIPQNNEQEFIKMAETLGYDSLIFLYTSEKNVPTTKSDKIKIKYGVLTTKGGKGKQLTFLQSGENDQKILENNPPNAIYGAETKAEKDYIHQRASGLNHIMCKFAAKNNVVIVFQLAPLLETNGVKRAQILGRIMQNIQLCRKYSVKTAIVSFAREPCQMRAPKDLQALFMLLGMHPAEVQKAFQSI